MSMNFESQYAADESLNQYWYTTGTIAALVAELSSFDPAARFGFLSSPSVFFALPESLRSRSKLFEFDERWKNEPSFVHFDFNHPEDLPQICHGTCDFLLLDPPLITEGPLEMYRRACDLLLVPGGKVLVCTYSCNERCVKDIFAAERVLFQPCMDRCVSATSFSLFANYKVSKALSQENPEIAFLQDGGLF
eukprot:TRINITY_DN67736_c0_g1_i1.p1 TRINITY_DN67736_c0_g1~~TRINITY_DN67736_c0_g1_i1.p1  ORF type:complete len:192 (-),score=30.91 TRINITY_DN67736_c0_g1_i1:188-763(-)